MLNINVNISTNYDPPTTINSDGDMFWMNSLGEFHREKGLPAIEGADGTKKWWVNGQRHRDNDLPAVEWADGSREWWVNGNRHRDGGLPAVEWAGGIKEWYVNGKRIK